MSAAIRHRAFFCPSVTKSDTSLLGTRFAFPGKTVSRSLKVSATLLIATIIRPGTSPGALQTCLGRG